MKARAVNRPALANARPARTRVSPRSLSGLVARMSRSCSLSLSLSLSPPLPLEIAERERREIRVVNSRAWCFYSLVSRAGIPPAASTAPDPAISPLPRLY